MLKKMIIEIKYLYNYSLYIKYLLLIIYFIMIIFISSNKIQKSKLNIFRKGRKYIDFCLQMKLLIKIISLNAKNKKLSVVIPIFNCQDSILFVIRSIQNQNMFEIEIILVNDNSSDDSLKIIRNIQKEDKRIIIINNKKNKGILYSRSIGVLESKGEYIFPLDNDDMVFDRDVFDIVYSEAFNHNYDIVGFKSVQVNNYNAKITEMRDGCHMHNKPFIIYQDELSLFGISQNNTLKISEVHIWSKCIKSSLYKKAIDKLGVKRYSYFLIWGEDTSMVFILFSLAESYRYIDKYGIFRFNRKLSASNKISNSNTYFYIIITTKISTNYRNRNYFIIECFPFLLCRYFYFTYF